MENKKAYIYALIGQFGPQVITLVTNIILARFLLPEAFGTIAVLNVFLSTASVLMDSGLGGSLVKEKNITTIDCSTIFVFNISISFILYIVIFLLSESIESFFDIPNLKNITRILCLCFVINSFGLIPKALLVKKVNFKALTEINLFSNILSSIAAVVFGIIYKNIYALLIYQLLKSFCQVLLSVYKSQYKYSFRFSIKSFKKLLSFGVYTTITAVIDNIYENIITVFFGKFYNAQQAGYVGQAKKIEELSAQSIAKTVNNVAFPILVKYQDNKTKFLNESNRIFRTLLAITIPILFTIGVFSEHIILILFGKQWIQSAEYLNLLIFAGVFILCESLNRNFIKSLTIVNKLLKITIWKRIIGIFVITFTAFLIPKYLLHSYIVSSFIGFLFNNQIFSKSIKISFWEQINVMIKILFPNVLFYIAMKILTLYTDSLLLQIGVALSLLFIYYFFVLPMYGINTRSIIVEKIGLWKKNV